ncbi:MAG: SusC/RagA family TonB-linked outer membrane protein, partial [Tissierellia bacterium]|nr:SusC/RagA family TonB-linked outer membrane protein [Tissierellia bacterium]
MIIFNLWLGTNLLFATTQKEYFSSESLLERLEKIKEKGVETGQTLSYSRTMIKGEVPGFLAETNNMEEWLFKSLEGTKFTYDKVAEKEYIVKQKDFKENEIVDLDTIDQQSVVKGLVVDINGEPLIGVNVLEKGTSNGTVTDYDGRFTLSTAENATLIFSYIGFESIEIERRGRDEIQITLQEDSEVLDEVVVVGYGTMKKSDLTGSVSEVNVNKLIDQPTVSIDQMLVGRVPGMQIQQGSGAPGAAPIITIRGSGSLGAGNQPLYVIDGMPYSNIDNENLNPLTFINPYDIESMTVLKDASSTSIYGSRGSNGVIIITTKNAGKDITEINFSSSIGTSQVPMKGRPQMMSAYDFATYQRERIALGIKNKLKRDAIESDYPEEYQNVESLGEGTNWYDLILRKALMQNYYLDIQKSQGNSRFFLGLGYSDQEGVIYSSGLERLSVNMNYKFNLEDKILIDASLRPTYVIQDRIMSGESRADYLSMALWGNPVMKAYDEEGKLIPYIQPPVTSYSANPWGFPNPVFALQNTDDKYSVLRNLGNISLQLNILPELSFKTILNTVYNNAELNSFKPSTIGDPNSPPKEGSAKASRSRSSAFNWLWENTLNYKKNFEKHSLAILAGYTAQKQRSRGLSLNAGPFA